MEASRDAFDPYSAMRALERHRVTYIIVGALARVIEGSGEVTDGIDIVPSLREENLRRLGLALDDLHARRRDGKELALGHDVSGTRVLELDTEAGEVKIVSEPAGTRGYDDLRRAAVREPLGQGLRPSVASVGDLARMLSALDRAHDREALRTLRHIAELERSLDRGIER